MSVVRRVSGRAGDRGPGSTVPVPGTSVNSSPYTTLSYYTAQATLASPARAGPHFHVSTLTKSDASSVHTRTGACGGSGAQPGCLTRGAKSVARRATTTQLDVL